MALQPCRECGHEVSTEADTCPNCGVRKPTQSSLMAFLTKSRGSRSGCGSGCGGLLVAIIGIGILAAVLIPSPEDGSGSSSFADVRYVHQATNVREGRSTDTDVVTTLAPGDSVRTGTQSQGWYEVFPGDAAARTAANRIGYVYGELLAANPPQSAGGSQRSGFNPDAEAVGAWTVCQQFLEDRLKAPSTADYPCCYSDFTTYQGNRVFEVRSYVDAENSFGAKIRNRFLCRVEYRGNERWRLQDLQIIE